MILRQFCLELHNWLDNLRKRGVAQVLKIHTYTQITLAGILTLSLLMRILYMVARYMHVHDITIHA